MGMVLLACGPTFDDLIPFLAAAALGLGVVKIAMYFAFVQAFRYRVAAPVPMRMSQAFTIALVRTVLGVAVIGGVWLTLWLAALSDEAAIATIWAVAAGERLIVWFGLGVLLAKLRGRRLVGWTLSGTGLDLACDAALFGMAWLGLLSPLLVMGVIVPFLVALHVIGRRHSLRSRFTARPLCTSCGYDLTGNLSGVCPECGTAVGVSIAAAA